MAHIQDLDTPALLIDADRMAANIASMAALVRDTGKQIRPHTKTHKTPEVARLQLAAGACGITVAKLGEAEVMADAGIGDILVANEVVGAIKMERLMALARRASVSVGVDSVEVAAPISAAAAAAGVVIPVVVEVDCGYGRCGVRDPDDVLRIGLLIADMPGVAPAGLFTHEGHVYRTGLEARRALCDAVCAKLADCAALLRGAGIPVDTISVGSTPSAVEMSRNPTPTEMRPGVYVFGDAMQVALGWSEADCALTVLATVVSRPDADTAIIDAGTKSMSGDRGMEGGKHGIVVGWDAVYDWASEEHGHLDLRGAEARPRVGDRLGVIPYHACACVNMHDTMWVTRGDEVVDRWPIAARGRIR